MQLTKAELFSTYSLSTWSHTRPYMNCSRALMKTRGWLVSDHPCLGITITSIVFYFAGKEVNLRGENFLKELEGTTINTVEARHLLGLQLSNLFCYLFSEVGWDSAVTGNNRNCCKQTQIWLAKAWFLDEWKAKWRTKHSAKNFSSAQIDYRILLMRFWPQSALTY